MSEPHTTTNGGMLNSNKNAAWLENYIRPTNKLRLRRTKIAHAQARKTYRTKIFKAKKEAWRRFTSEATTPYLQAQLNRILAPKPTFQLGHIRRQDGSITSNTQDSLKELLQEHFPNSTLTNPNTDTYQPTLTAPSHQYSWISRNRIDQAIKRLKNNKKPGPDDLYPEVIKQLPESTIATILDLFNASIALGYIPPIWKTSKVVFLPKPSKKDAMDPRSYRPITLSSFLLKLLERLVLYRLEETTFKLSPLHPAQHGFIKGRNTETATTILVDEIQTMKQNNSLGLIIFLDIKGAFDN
jgi:hypothetical protein